MNKIEIKKYIKKLFTQKTREVLISEKVDQLMRDVLICDFSNKEIAVIFNKLSTDVKVLLEQRKTLLDIEILETSKAIDSLC